MKQISQQLSHPAYDDLGEDEGLESILPEGATASLEAWEHQRILLRECWDSVLGNPSVDCFDRKQEIVDSFDHIDCHCTVFRQSTGPDAQQTLLMMEPNQSPYAPRPGAVIPYYHPDVMAGINLTTHESISEDENLQFGRHLVQQGYVVVCTEAFPYNTIPEPEVNEGFAWWEAAARKILDDNPQWTGMGKLVWDTQRAIDLLLDQPNIDSERIVVMGHSLGGKMAFFTGSLDDRIKATIANDFGIGFSFTNWDAPWYLGDQIHQPDFTSRHHQLLALHAPRPFLLIGGEYDKPESWQYLNEVKKVYALYGKEESLGFLDHGTGHQPPMEALHRAYRWLAEQFALPQ